MIKYIVAQQRHPITKKEQFLARPYTPEPINIDEISQRIAAGCTLTRHDILGCLSAFQEQLIQLLQEGRSVRFGDVGTFHLTLRGGGASTAEEFTTSMIKSIHVVFIPSVTLKQSLSIGHGGVTFLLMKNNEAAAAPETGGDAGGGGDLGPESGNSDGDVIV